MRFVVASHLSCCYCCYYSDIVFVVDIGVDLVAVFLVAGHIQSGNHLLLLLFFMSLLSVTYVFMLVVVILCVLYVAAKSSTIMFFVVFPFKKSFPDICKAIDDAN